MKDAKEFFGLLGNALKGLYRNPVVVVPSLLLGAFIFGFSALGGRVAYSFQTTLSNVAWTVFSSLLLLIVFAFTFAGLIGMVSKGRPGMKDFFYYGKRFWLRNFLIILVITAITGALWAIAQYGGMLIGHGFGMSSKAATVLFVLIYFAGLVGGLAFLSMSSFCLVLYDSSVGKSIKESGALVKKEYLPTLSLLVVFFIIITLTDYIPSYFGAAVEYGLVLPFAVFAFTRFVTIYSGKK